MDIPFGLLAYALNEVMPYLVCVGAAYLGCRFVRAFERSCAQPEQLRALSARLRALEEMMGELDERVTDTAEAQRFASELFLPIAGFPESPLRSMAMTEPSPREPRSFHAT